MLLLNILFVLLALAYQFYNLITLTRTLKYRNIFMYLKIVNNDYVKTTIRPYKVRLLKYSRIFLLFTIIIAPFFIIFNQSALLLSIYLIVFLILPFILIHYLISKNVKEIMELNIVESNQDVDIKTLGLFYFDPQGDHFYTYGCKRFALNLKTIPGIGTLTSIAVVLLIILIALPLFLKPATPKEEITSKLETKNITLVYKDKSTTIPFDKITSVKKLDTLPPITSKINGYQEDGYIVGQFNLQGVNNANLYITKDAPTVIEIVANKKYYYFSDSDQANSNTIYNTIEKQIPDKKTKKKSDK